MKLNKHCISESVDDAILLVMRDLVHDSSHYLLWNILKVSDQIHTIIAKEIVGIFVKALFAVPCAIFDSMLDLSLFRKSIFGFLLEQVRKGNSNVVPCLITASQRATQSLQLEILANLEKLSEIYNLYSPEMISTIFQLLQSNNYSAQELALDMLSKTQGLQIKFIDLLLDLAIAKETRYPSNHTFICKARAMLLKNIDIVLDRYANCRRCQKLLLLS